MKLERGDVIRHRDGGPTLLVLGFTDDPYAFEIADPYSPGKEPNPDHREGRFVLGYRVDYEDHPDPNNDPRVPDGKWVLGGRVTQKIYLRNEVVFIRESTREEFLRLRP